MEIPVISWALRQAENFGKKSAEAYFQKPSKKNPAITVSQEMGGEIIQEWVEGRPLDQEFTNPVREAYRRGLIKSINEEGTITPEKMQEGLRAIGALQKLQKRSRVK